MASLSSIDSTDPNERTCHVGNLSDKVTEPILKELFIQMGPVENVFIKPHYAFVVFEDVESVPFASDCLDRITLFGQKITVRPRSHTEQAKRYRPPQAYSPVNTPSRMGESRSAGYLDNVRDRSFDDYDRCRDSPRRYGPSHSRDRSYARQPYRQRQQGFGVNNGLPQNSEHRRFAWAETVSQSPVGLAHGSMTMTSVGLSTPLQRYANVPPINMRSPNVIPAFQSPQAVYSSPSYFQETRGVYCTPSQGLVVHRSYSYFQ